MELNLLKNNLCVPLVLSERESFFFIKCFLFSNRESLIIHLNFIEKTFYKDLIDFSIDSTGSYEPYICSVYKKQKQVWNISVIVFRKGFIHETNTEKNLKVLLEVN